MSRDEQIIEGLRIILKYQPSDSGYDIRADYDSIYAGDDWEYSFEDICLLNEMDWEYNSDRWYGWLYRL
jgi:hypothetical protein